MNWKSLTTPFVLAYRNLRSNLARTILSLLGIVIGITAVILVLSLGNGIRQYVFDMVESFGTDFVEIEIKAPKTGKTSTQNVAAMAGGMAITTLKLEDIEEVAKISNLGDWYSGLVSQQVFKYENKDKQMMIFGVTEGMIDVDKQLEMASGRFIEKDDDDSLRQVVVLGSAVAEDFFDGTNPIGETVKIKGQSYKVVGVSKARGGTGVFSFDDVVYLPLKTLQKKILGVDYVQFAMFNVKDMDKIARTTQEMTEIMRDQHDIEDPDDDDFAVTSSKEMVEILDQIFVTMNILLLALTSISLIVGGVGIMNVMYVAITERTFEIGLRKSIGAKRRDILRLFLFEAIFLTFFGGVIGIVLGFILSKIAEWVAAGFNLNLGFPITLGSVLIALAFSLITGVVFGLRPAYKASKLSPMEALRKE